MKTPHLFACLAVAATASAAEIKHPADVLQAWNETVARSSIPPVGDLNLRRETARPGLASRPSPVIQLSESPLTQSRAPRPKSVPRVPGIDAPGYRIPKTLPDNLPPGAKAWEYGGQTYWLVPLVPAREK